MTNKTIIELIDDYAEARHVGGCHTSNAKTSAARAAVLEALSAAQAGVPAGYVPVPKEPTREMYLAACRAFSDWDSRCKYPASYSDGVIPKTEWTHNDVYSAMLAAAPQPSPSPAPADQMVAFTKTMLEIYGNEFPDQGEFAGDHGWSDHWAIFRAGVAHAALPAPAVRWNDAAILSLLNRFGDGPYGEEDVLTMRRALVHYEEIRRDLEGTPTAPAQPIDMVLHCPKCGLQHIDAPDERTPDWKNEPHRSHLCHGCGHIWRPADVATNGVQAVKTKGNADSPIAHPAPAQPGQEGELTWTVFNSGAQVAEVESLAEAMEYLTPERMARQWCAVCVVDQVNMPQGRAARAAPQPATADALPDEKTCVDYALQYGGRCRDCADENGVCPGSGLPCEGARKAVTHVVQALRYGLQHGYLRAAQREVKP